MCNYCTLCVYLINLIRDYYQMTKFQIYIRKLGLQESAKALNISQRSAEAYMYGARKPRLRDVPNLVKLSKGSLCFDSFHNEDI